ncbi:hypothetical protein [Alicyclobacillus sp. ALC3]|uniref:hypothetical protein n=1 Tax=Alicyclobacillus sp. ALC3 TaxID=2796143 RepID=UPI002378CB2C|nr:hypothetical protein [Alicyclobacillus sp. ALC3]WDL98482.1 hypothetical protein JC200_07310 [Alicyclobacillus sp. ALC3]
MTFRNEWLRLTGIGGREFPEWVATFIRNTQLPLLSVTDNSQSLEAYRYQLTKLLYKWLNRRSQRKSFNYTTFNAFLARHPLPGPKIYVHIYGQPVGKPL